MSGVRFDVERHAAHFHGGKHGAYTLRSESLHQPGDQARTRVGNEFSRHLSTGFCDFTGPHLCLPVGSLRKFEKQAAAGIALFRFGDGTVQENRAFLLAPTLQ